MEHKTMTASQQAKTMGLKSLTEVAEHTGASLQTLINWHNNKPKLFNVVCLGVGTKLINQEKGNDN